MMTRTSVTLLAALLGSALTFGVAHAQFELFTGSFGINLSLEPAYPQANETVTVTANSVFTNLSTSELSWYINDALFTKGVGVTSIRTSAGAPGSQTTVSIRAVNSLGGEISGEAVIAPADAEILWEADSLVPPFYKGRSLPGAGTRVSAEALVRLSRKDGSLVPTQEITYTWSRNGSVVPSVSGKGRNRATFPAPLLFSTDTLSITAESSDGTLHAEARTLVPSTDTLLQIYEEHPLFGTLYNRTLPRSSEIPEPEVTLAAFPLFADARSAGDSRLSYLWTVNGARVPADPDEPDKITIQATGDAVRATLDLALEHATNWFEAAKGTWNIQLSAGGASFGDPFSPLTQ